MIDSHWSDGVAVLLFSRISTIAPAAKVEDDSMYQKLTQTFSALQGTGVVVDQKIERSVIY
jgi:hypothetical protein